MLIITRAVCRKHKPDAKPSWLLSPVIKPTPLLPHKTLPSHALSSGLATPGLNSQLQQLRTVVPRTRHTIPQNPDFGDALPSAWIIFPSSLFLPLSNSYLSFESPPGVFLWFAPYLTTPWGMSSLLLPPQYSVHVANLGAGGGTLLTACCMGLRSAPPRSLTPSCLLSCLQGAAPRCSR